MKNGIYKNLEFLNNVFASFSSLFFFKRNFSSFLSNFQLNTFLRINELVFWRVNAKVKVMQIDENFHKSFKLFLKEKKKTVKTVKYVHMMDEVIALNLKI